jgi:hypothetical protein
MLIERVKSESIRAIGYDEHRELLWVEFRSRPGGYVYSGVPHDVFDELMQAESLGGYVNEAIKSNYRCEYRAQPPNATRAHSSRTSGSPSTRRRSRHSAAAESRASRE